MRVDRQGKIRMISDDRMYAEIEDRAYSRSLRLTDNFVTRKYWETGIGGW